MMRNKQLKYELFGNRIYLQLLMVIFLIAPVTVMAIIKTEKTSPPWLQILTDNPFANHEVTLLSGKNDSVTNYYACSRLQGFIQNNHTRWALIQAVDQNWYRVALNELYGPAGARLITVDNNHAVLQLTDANEKITINHEIDAQCRLNVQHSP